MKRRNWKAAKSNKWKSGLEGCKECEEQIIDLSHKHVWLWVLVTPILAAPYG